MRNSWLLLCHNKMVKYVYFNFYLQNKRVNTYVIDKLREGQRSSLSIFLALPKCDNIIEYVLVRRLYTPVLE